MLTRTEGSGSWEGGRGGMGGVSIRCFNAVFRCGVSMRCFNAVFRCGVDKGFGGLRLVVGAVVGRKQLERECEPAGIFDSVDIM